MFSIAIMTKKYCKKPNNGTRNLYLLIFNSDINLLNKWDRRNKSNKWDRRSLRKLNILDRSLFWGTGKKGLAGENWGETIMQVL